MGKPPLTPLYVRIPEAHSQRLDQLSTTLGQSKQQVVTELLASGLATSDVETPTASTEKSTTSPTAEVLTLGEVAILLAVTPQEVEEAVRTANLPARRIGQQWRFSKQAVLGWLAMPDPSIKHRPGFTNRGSS